MDDGRRMIDAIGYRDHTPDSWPLAHRPSSMGYIGHLARLEAFEETPRPFAVEAWIGGLNAQEEAVLGGVGKAPDVEQRVVRLGQTVHGKHPQGPG